MKKMRAIAFILLFVMMFNVIPVQVFADTLQNEQQNEELVKEQLRTAVDETKYPNGLFDFLTTRMNTSEDLSSVELVIVRKGGTAGKASITLKAIDVSAKYGKDYTISIPKGVLSQTLPENEEARPLIENAIIGESESGQDTTVAEEVYSQVPTVTEAVYSRSEYTIEYEELPLPELKDLKSPEKKVSLREARDAFLGNKSEAVNWREADLQEKEAAKNAYNEMYESTPGVSCVLKFEEGEYIKKVRFNIIDDKISEDDEQVLLVLLDPAGAELGEANNAYMNIEDNEEKEKITFEIAEKEISANRNSDFAEITVKRTAGLYRYGSINVGTGALTAQPEIDYTPVMTELRFLPGQESQKVRVPLLDGGSREELQFVIKLDGESPNLSEEGNHAALVTIEAVKEAFIGIPYKSLQSMEKNKAEILDIRPKSDFKLQSTIGYEGDRKVKKLTIRDVKSSNTSYDSGKGWIKMVTNGLLQHPWVQYNADLTMVEKIVWDWCNPSAGTHYTEYVGWFRWEDRYWTDFYSYMKLPNGNGKTEKGTVEQDWYATYILNDEDRKQGSIEFGTYVEDKTRDSDFNLGTVNLYYKPINIVLKNSESSDEADKDSLVYPITWQSKSLYKASDKGTLIGGLSFKNQSSATNQKAYYDGDIVEFSPLYKDSNMAKKAYLWGYKIYITSGSGAGGYFYIKGNTLNIRDIYTDKMKDVNGKDILRQYVISTDKSKNEYITVRPVFKAKNAYVQINFDTNKGGMVNNSFVDGEVIKVGMFDTVEFNAYANKGEYVFGYDPKDWNYEGKNLTTDGDERILKDKDAAEGKKVIKENKGRFQSISGLNTITDSPGSLSFIPQKTYSTFEVKHEPSMLTVMAHPKSYIKGKNGEITDPKDADKGIVFYIPKAEETDVDPDAQPVEDPEEDPVTDPWEKTKDPNYNPWADPEKAKYAGDYLHELHIENVLTNRTYKISAFHDPDYIVKWRDFTGNTSKSGEFTDAEEQAISKYERLFDRSSVTGNTLNYTVKYSNSLIYYNFVPKPNQGIPSRMRGTVYLVGGDILSNDENAGAATAMKPIPFAKLYINDLMLTADESGRFDKTDANFLINDKNLVTVSYNNIDYAGYFDTDFPARVKIEEYDSFIPYDFTILDGDKEIEAEKMNNKDADFEFSFKVTNVKQNLSAEKALIRIYSQQGTIRKLLDEKEYLEVVPSEGLFSFTFNPAKNGIMPGDRMTVQLIDQTGAKHIEHNVGFTFLKYLKTFSLLTSFNSPVKADIEMVGVVDAVFDLGLSGKLDDFKDDHQKDLTIVFGFSKDWSDKIKKEIGDRSSGNTQPKDTPTKELKDAAKGGLNEKDKKDLVNDAVDKDGKNKKPAKLTTDMKFNLSASLYLYMALNDRPGTENYGEYYFKEMIMSATLSGSFDTKVEIQTPIGVTVYMRLILGGDITAVMAIEQYEKKFYFDGNGNIDFSKAGGFSDFNRDFTIYSNFSINPYITLVVGATIPLAEISISGKAQFNMDFTTTGSGSGRVTVNAELALKILVFNFKWEVANKTWDLFNYGNSRGFSANSIFAGTDYMYESAENYEVTSREYLDNRGNWQGGTSKRMSLMAAGDNAYNEQTLQRGVYPYPYTLLAPIGDDEQILVFLDDDTDRDDKNRTQLYYSIYQGGSWSRPQKVDNDSTPDDNPWISDMGDKVLVAWSSAVDPVEENDTIIEVLNNRNIKARFFDKGSQAFGDVQNVTYETANDTWSDTDPYIAYWQDRAGKENLMITYTKTQYEITEGNGEDAVLGDIIKPSETFLAYRFYDFINNRWGESSDLGDGYYGQGFIDVSEYAEVDESDILISEDMPIYDPDNPEFRFDGDWQWNGYWSRVPELSEVSTGSFGKDPLIADSNAIGYEDFAILAYSVDLDRDIATTTDRKLFMQLYSFAEERFYPPIYFDDTKGQADLEFVQSDDNIYLYYISDGDIVSIDIGYLFSQGFLRYDIPGRDTHVLVLNKLKEVYREPEVVVKHRYETRINESGEVEIYNECPIDQFMVKSDDNNVYVMWTENEISYREGVDPNSPEGAEPDNRFSEKHLYAARQILSGIKEIQQYDENGEELTYPEYDEMGNKIDYNAVPDINYEVGKVKAGDPIIVKFREAEWSQPVKLTNEQGANFSDIDFEILSDGNLRAVFVKGMSEVMDVAGEDMPVENINSRALMTADFNVSIKEAEVSMQPVKMPSQNEVIHPEIELKNKGLSPLKDISVELYQLTGDDEEKVYEINDISLRGGEKKDISLSWQAPEKITETKLRVLIKKGGEILCSAEQDIKVESVVDVISANIEAVGRDRFKIKGTAVNHGNTASDNAEIFANASGQVIGSTSIGSLDVGEDKYFEFFANTEPDMYEGTADEDGSVTETLKINVYSNGSVVKLNCERYADKAEIDVIKNIKTFELKANNNKVSDSLSLRKGTRVNLTPELTYADKTAHTPKLVYVSSNEDVADFSQGYMTLSGKNTGTATITAYALPPINSGVLSQSGFERTDNFTTMAEAAVKAKSFTVNVYTHTVSDNDDKEGRPSRDNGSPGAAESPNNVTVTTTVKAHVDKSGIAEAAVTEEQIREAVKKAAEAAKLGEGTESKIEIKVEMPQDAKTVETSIPSSAMRTVSNNNIQMLTITTPLASITLDNKTIAGIADKATEDIKITASKVDSSALTAEAKKLVGDRPVFDFSISSGGNVISEFDGNVTVSLPYTPNTDEDTNAIVIYYINAKGMPEAVSNCVYNAQTGTITFKTNHFSRFAVGYNIITFRDVSSNAWYNDAVVFVAARGITTGTGNGNFSPDEKLTRAQFLVMTMRAYGIKPDKKWKDNFDDAGNTYYTAYLAAAKGLGITKGTGNNLFKPDNEITRQEMFTLLYNSLKLIGRLPEGKAGKALTEFNDSNRIAPWAKDAMAQLAEAGIISGSNGKLDPEDTGSRAQMAQIIYNLLLR